jgi:SsrA-binding protein
MAKKSTAKSGGKAPKKDSDRLIAKNRRAHFNFELGDHYEAGLSLMGSEARSLRDNSADLSDAWVDINDGEAWVRQMRIPPHVHARDGHTEVRPRKLLLHRRELDALAEARDRDRMTIVVTKIYFKNGRVKLEIAVGRGKQAHDKRQTIKAREADREARTSIRNAR